MKKLRETDVIRKKGFDTFEGEIISGNRYSRFKSFKRYLIE